MSVALPPAVQALVDAKVITPAQARDAVKAAPPEDQFRGTARCVNPGCDERETSRPIMLRRAYVEVRDTDMPMLVLGRTEYLSAVKDTDLSCPECEQPCAIMAEPPPVYQKAI